MNIQEISTKFWTDTKATAALAALVRDVLAQEPAESPPMSTTKLVRSLLPNANAMQFKNLCSLMGAARDSGVLDGYFTRGRRGLYGHALVLWKKTGADVEDSDEITTVEVEAAQAEVDRLVAETNRKALDTSPEKAST